MAVLQDLQEIGNIKVRHKIIKIEYIRKNGRKQIINYGRYYKVTRG